MPSITTSVPQSSEPDAGDVILIAELTGGCAMMGPNCERFVVFGDGTVEAYRSGEIASQPVDVGSIDPTLVATLHSAIGTTDLEALRKRLLPGECRGCFDATDTLATFTVGGVDVSFSSIETELAVTEPVFAAMWIAIDAAQDATDVPSIER